MTPSNEYGESNQGPKLTFRNLPHRALQLLQVIAPFSRRHSRTAALCLPRLVGYVALVASRPGVAGSMLLLALILEHQLPGELLVYIHSTLR